MMDHDLERFLIHRHGVGLVHIDLAMSGLLPANWQLDIFRVAAIFAQDAELRANTPTSLEDEGTLLAYRLVTGEVIARKLSWLDELYRTTLTTYASFVAMEPMIPSPDIRNGVNLNVLWQSGQRYERHTDSNPLTGILFVT